jgi:hypothetical protein
VNCGCESCQSGSTYWCVKQVWRDGGSLTEAERTLIGDLPKAPPSPMALYLAAEARRTEREARRLAGIRWLIDVGTDERLELT